MRYRTRNRWQTALVLSAWAGLLAVGAVQEASAQADQAAGSIVGMVYDSITAGPLADAEVLVWNSSFRTMTDEEGRFRLDGVPAGSHNLVFVHEAMLELGVSTGNVSVEVIAGEETTVEMGTPSPFTILRGTCTVEGHIDGTGMAVGMVGDDGSGVPLPGARVHLTWQDEEGAPHTDEAITNSFGWFRFCSVPADELVGVTALFFDRRAARQELSLASGEEAWLHFEVGSLSPGSISGKLVDNERGWGIEDAEVRLLGTMLRTVSRSGGDFRFPSVPPGEYTMEVRHLAYGERRDSLNVGSAMALTVSVSMSVEPIELDPISVEVASIVDLDGIIAGGTLISREEVEAVRHRARDLADVLRMQHMSDVIVRRGSQGELCVGITTGQVRMFKEECSSAIFYLDNARISRPEMVMNLPATDIDRIVVYRPIDAGNLFGLGSGNGVIVVYTKSGVRRR